MRGGALECEGIDERACRTSGPIRRVLWVMLGVARFSVEAQGGRWGGAVDPACVSGVTLLKPAEGCVSKGVYGRWIWSICTPRVPLISLFFLLFIATRRNK